jgi:formaldehyde-activating enzyme involved in methanogenesis
MNYKSFYLTAVLLFFKFSLIAQACNSSSIDSINSCSSYTWTNGVTYTSSNNSAKDTFINAAGCDSIVTLNLTIIIDSIKPNVLSKPLTVSLDSSGNVSVSANDVDNGSNDNCAIATRILSKSTFNCSDIGSNTVFLIVTDINGNFDLASTVITVQDITPPDVNTNALTVYLDANGNANINSTAVDNGSTDNCGIVSRSLSKTSFNCSNIGTNNIFLTVTDLYNNIDSASALITVIDTLKPNVITKPITLNLDSSGNAVMSNSEIDNGSSDNCNIATRIASKVSFNCSDLGDNTVYLIVTDNYGNVDSASAIVTVQDLIKPSVNSKSVNINLDSSGNANITVLDIDNGSTDNCGIVSRTLSKSSFNCSDIGSNTIFLIVEDLYGNIDSMGATVTVNDDIKPKLKTKTANVYLGANGIANLSASAVDNGSSDNCGIASRTISKSIFNCLEIGNNSIDFKVTDINGNSDSASVVITVLDTIKPIINTQSLSINLDTNGNANISVTDVDNGSSDNCFIATRSLSKSNFDCSDIGSNSVYLLITDVNGNIDSASVSITVNDTIKPNAVSQPITVFIDSTGIGFANPMDADNGSSDNCSIVARSLTKPVFICSDIGTDSAFLVVTDLGGNKDSISVKITVKDTIKPIILAQSLTVYLDSNGIGNTSVANIDIGSTDNCGIDTIKISKSNFNCSDLGINSIYLAVTDVNGNTDSVSVVIDIKDTIKPKVLTQPIIVNIDSTGIGFANPVEADNGSTDNCSIVNRSLTKPVFICSDIGVDTVFLVVTDSDGNKDSASVIVTIQDKINPSVITKSITVNLDSTGNGSITLNEIDDGSSDNCGILNRRLSKSIFDCTDIGVNSVYLIVTDVNGNTDSAIAIVNVVDLINPIVITQPVTVILDQDGKASIALSDIDNGSSDNCVIANRSLSKTSFDCSQIGDNIVILTVTDENGNSNSASSVVTVKDDLKPTVITQPSIVILDNNGNGSISSSDIDNGSIDNCDIANISLSRSNFDCSDIGSNSVYLIVTDVNGNIDSAIAIITVQDTIRPTVVTQVSDIELGYCDAVYTYSLPTGDDNCSIAITQVDGLPSGSNFPVGITLNTFEISDPSGNTVTTSFTVDVRDRYLPFTITDFSICNNQNKIDLTKGFNNISFSGNGVESNSRFFNPNSLEPGDYSITADFLDSMGCNTTEQFEIEIKSIPETPIIKRVASDQVITTKEYNFYQWYRNGEELTGENKKLLRVNELGIYSVTVSDIENCSQTSEVFEFGIPVNEENVSNQGAVKVFPNPTRDFVFIQINDEEDSHLLSVSDGLGNQLISQETNSNVVKLDLSSLVPGNYFLNVLGGITNETIVIVKK